MKYNSLVILCGLALLLCLVAPASCSATPLWRVAGPTSGDLSGVVISEDGSTIIVGGDQMISLTTDGRKRWSGWSATCLAVSSNGDNILSSQGPVLRLISSLGEIVWEQPIDTAITDISMAPNGSVIAAAGGGRIRTMKLSGDPIASNASMSVNHIRIMPDGGRILITTTRNAQLSNFSLISDWTDTNVTQNLVAVSGDGSTIVTATENRVRMYNGTGKFLWEKKLPHGVAEALAYSRDGSTIVVGMDDSMVHVLNRNGAGIWSDQASNWITSVAVSNDGNTIAAGSMDKKLSVFNHGGILLGNYSAKSAIGFNSVAVTGDGSLIVLVDQSAVYGFSRTAMIEEALTRETITEPTTEVTEEITTTLPATTVRRPTTRPPTIPTPYPSATATEETPLSPGVVVVALGLLLLCRHRKT